MAQYNKVVRFALSDSGMDVAQGINISQVKFNSKIDKGEEMLQDGFRNPDSQSPVDNMNCYTAGSICHDYSGNLYIADSIRHAIYRIDEGNKLSVVAGQPGTSGNLSNVTIKDPTTMLNRAAFYSPEGICCDKSGNLYVADTGNHCIKMISKGNIYLVAGSSAGFVDGTDARSAKFYSPRDVAIDKSGTIYVADMLNHAIRKIKGGVVTTVAGNGHAGNANNVQASKDTATFDQPVAVSVDNSGNVYVIDGVNRIIKKITPNGWVYRFSGGGGVGISLGLGGNTIDTCSQYTCSYTHLTGMDTDASGNVYVVDMGTGQVESRLLKLDAMGVPSVVVNFDAISEDYYAYDVTCTPGQKLYVTFSIEDWSTDASSSSSSSEDNR
jgi:sugar lactone lactonase YvrE